jgi:hypothetical protein
VAYPNRTDLSANRSPQSGTMTAASAGQGAPAATPAGPPPGPAGIAPEDTVNLFDAGNQGRPLTSGLPTGPGAGPAPESPLGEDAMFVKYLPEFERIAQREGTPDSFKGLVRYLQGRA